MTKILFCTCENEYQDKLYGAHKRLCNSKKPKNQNQPNEFRCTVCGTVKST
uniref:Uncharacterized protein n=1 Tax=viral metagenome TaxID=1070528 RepID=A0A6M3LPZ1_9ZZZZ